MKRNSFSKNEQGQAIVIMAFALIALLAFAALAIDGGNAYVERRRAQNGADAGALAGARQVWINRVNLNSSETLVPPRLTVRPRRTVSAIPMTLAATQSTAMSKPTIQTEMATSCPKTGIPSLLAQQAVFPLTRVG